MIDDNDESCENMNKQLRNNMIVLLFAVILSLILNAAHILLPFMFGPIIASVICVRVFRLEIEWPFWLSQIGLVLLGVQIGSTFTKNVILDIKDDWLTIILITVMLLALALVIAFFFKKIAKVADYANPNYQIVSQKFMQLGHDEELKVLPYTVNKLKESQKLIDIGVDGIISDVPEDLFEL